MAKSSVINTIAVAMTFIATTTVITTTPQVNGYILDTRTATAPNAPLWKLIVGDETMAIWSTKIWPQTPWVDPQPEGLKAWESCGSGCLYELGSDPSERHVRHVCA